METFVEKARSVLDRRQGERMTLEELARAVGASPFHLQRRFKEAFGVSPREYQDSHRLEAVKSSLKNGSRVTDAVFAAGYGSVSRFYEKASSRLGMPARAYRAKGKGLQIGYTSFASPLGQVLVAATADGVCSVKLGDSAKALVALLQEEFKEADLSNDSSGMEKVKKDILAFIGGEAILTRLPVDIRGTVFQRKVWEALKRIPAGETRSYGEIARAIGAPRAVRAVGSACGANPVALVVPCHRAVRTDGSLGGYAWGLERKQKLLAIEKRTRSK